MTIANAPTLERELEWLSAVIAAGVSLYLGQECPYRSVHDIEPPPLAEDGSGYAGLVTQHEPTFDERLVMILALAPYLRPQILDPLLLKNPNIDRGFTEFGGVLGGHHGGFWPTVETAAFLLAGADLERRFAVQALFEPDHFLRGAFILQFEEPPGVHSLFDVPLQIHRSLLGQMTTGQPWRPAFCAGFPAQRLTTPMEWEDLVLADAIREEVEEIRAWIVHRHTLLKDWQLERRIKPGFRSLFHGPPGTGKTLTASLLGKSTGLDVYRVDLSLVVSKWVGETEKNLANVFDQAQSRDWILFFDEADALFGKRTQTSSSNDRYANQEVSYLLQRVEDFPGVVILASNLKGNLDEAFARRFQSMVYFPLPGQEERALLWRNAFSRIKLESGVNLDTLAREYDVAGGAIINVLRYASLMALRRGKDTVRLQDIRQGIRREFRKDGKMM